MSDTDTPTRKVQLAYPWTDSDGKDHDPDDVVEVDLSTAAQLLDGGRARVPDDDKGDDTVRPEIRPDGTTSVAAEDTRRTSRSTKS